MSGSSLSNKAMSTDPVGSSRKLAGLVGCPTNESGIMVHCLRRCPTDQLLEASKSVTKSSYNIPSPSPTPMTLSSGGIRGAKTRKLPSALYSNGYVPFGPVIDGKLHFISLQVDFEVGISITVV